MKKLTLMGLGMLTAMGMVAAPITPEQALQRLASGRNGKAAAEKLVRTPVWTAVTPGGMTSAYVFNNADGNGFRVLAADDAAYAVLGYSDSGSIDPKNMSPEFEFWMQMLGAQMEKMISKGVVSGEKAPAYDGWERVEPMVKTKWNQGAPYNRESPRMGNTQTFTGCVATATAQVMNYFQYPDVAQGSINYYWEKGNKQLSMTFGEKPFDWKNMLNYYVRGFNEEQANAVAYLMKCVGYSVEMDFGTESSGTQGSMVADALKTYFKYDKNVNVQYRIGYSASQWATMVYNNLKNVGPLVMNGHIYEGGGHSFVCDGYDGKGYFHFNWGWGGISDGWYLLESMRPEGQDIGGASGTGFNYGLNAIFGIQKPTAEPEVTYPDNMIMSGGVTASFDGDVLIFKETPYYPAGWYNAMGHDIRVNVGAIVEPIDGTEGENVEVDGRLGGMQVVRMITGSYYPSAEASIDWPDLPDGKYKVTVATRDLSNRKSVYIPVIKPFGFANYVYVTVKDGQRTVENIPVPELQGISIASTSPLYATKNAKFTVKLKNDTEFELTETLVPGFLDEHGNIVMIAGVGPSTVDANSEAELEWLGAIGVTAGNRAPSTVTEYTLALVNPITNEVLVRGDKVNVNPNPKNLRLRCQELVVDGVTPELMEWGERTLNTFKVGNPDSFGVTIKCDVMAGFFDGVMTAGIFTPNAEAFNDLDPVVQGLYTIQPFMEPGEERSFNIPVEFPQAEKDKLYVFYVSYTDASLEKSLSRIYFTPTTSGVVEIDAEDAQAPVHYFNLQGAEIADPLPGQVVIRVQGKKAVKVIR